MQRTTIETIGETSEPVIVIDDFHPHPDLLRQMAEKSSYQALRPYYPGVQANADPRHLEPVANAISKILKEVFGQTRGASIVQCAFSLVTTPEADLAPIQRLPHIDTTDPGRVALLHYLSGDELGGTGFFRHVSTGLERLTETNYPVYEAALGAEGMPGPGYTRGSDHRFEMIHAVPAKPNRAVLYRSALLHSGLIPEGAVLSDDPTQGRLTINSFFQENPARTA